METHIQALDRGCAVTVRVVGADEDGKRRVTQPITASLDRLCDLYDLASVGYCAVGATGLIREVNVTLAAILGVERSALVTVPLSGFIQKEDQDDLRRLLHQALAAHGGPPATCELRLVRADGSTLWTQFVVSLEPCLGTDGGACQDSTRGADVGLTLGVVTTDISERKAAEAMRWARESELAHAQKLESVGRLVGGIANQLNNMLAVVLGNAELALRQVGASSPARAGLEDICMAAERSAELVQQLLAHAGKKLVAPKVIDLNATVAQTVASFRRGLRDDVQVAWKPGEDLWPVRIDPSQVDRILVNLAANARDAIADGGTITIETHNRSVSACTCADRACRGTLASPVTRDADAYVAIVVSDDGCGMDQATLALAFEPFFTTKDVGKGTGLGLATVRGEVRQNHGVITVQSARGAGTTFTICLPRHEEAPSQAPGATSAAIA